MEYWISPIDDRSNDIQHNACIEYTNQLIWNEWKLQNMYGLGPNKSHFSSIFRSLKHCFDSNLDLRFHLLAKIIRNVCLASHKTKANGN